MLLLIGSSLAGYAQNNWDNVPSKAEKSVPELTRHLTAHLNDDREKIKAVYNWITHRIAYDYESLTSDKCFTYTPAEDVLKSQKTLCFGYVNLMRKMLEEIDIQSEEVVGYTNVEHPYYIQRYMIDDHSWIAIKLDGEWYLADPTWDAGYIGAIPKKPGKINVEKQLKKLEKTREKNEKRIEKGKDPVPLPELDTIPEREYTGKVGFVPQPAEDWFMISPDSFLIKHLPVSPMWQLRADTLPLNVFKRGAAAVRVWMETDHQQANFNFRRQLAEFEALSPLEKYLYTAEDGYSYNTDNKRFKALQYYTWLQILNNKEVKKYFKELPRIYTTDLYREMLAKIDTTIAYAKAGESITKEMYTERKNIINDVYRQERSVNQDLFRYAEKGMKWNDDALADIIDRNNKLEEEQEKLEEDILKSVGRNPVVEEFELDSPPALEAIPEMADSMQKMNEAFGAMIDAWEAETERSVLQSILDNNNYVKYLLNQRIFALEQKSLLANHYIDRLDSVLQVQMKAQEWCYNDSLVKEILPRELYRMMKSMDSYSRQIKSALRSQEVAGAGDITNYYLTLAYQKKKDLYNLNREAISYHNWLIGYLDQFVADWRQIIHLAEDQEDLSEEKKEYLLEQAEHGNNRSEDLSQTMQNNSESWEEKIDNLLH